MDPSKLPPLALSVRQPWAWAIFHANPVKGVENRDWNPTNPGLRYRGPVAIHASAGLAREEYDSASETIRQITGDPPPPARDLLRGGIIGSVVVQDVIRTRDVKGDPKWLSPWFFGPVGLILKQPQACAFIPCKGALGFFEWAIGDPAEVPTPARWMLPVEQPQGSLL